nr:hypothetical protein YSBCXYJI_YSBCXYJI_CDS_0105 [Caudoviricetes sp.]
MAIKTAKEKLQGHDSAGKNYKENNDVNKEVTAETKAAVISTAIDEFDTVKIYKNEVIFDENNPEDNPPTSLQSYQGEQFLMCPPFGASNAIANNSWMSEEDEPIDRFTYMEEWLRLYKDLSSIGMVYIAPTHSKLQDQIYISNGVWVPFHANQYCLMPNFKVEGRKENKDLGIPGENAVNAPFMKMLGYRVTYMPEFDEKGEPMYFEGSADIKMINCENPHATVWVCGTGIRTSENAARWIEKWLNEIDEDNAVNAPFMKMLGYRVTYMPEFDEKGEPMYFEGSADIKMINCENPHATVWVCGTGIRTSENAARWIEKWLNEIDEDPKSAHKVISYPQKDFMMYHQDCVCFPVDCKHTVLYTVNLEPKILAEIEKYTEVIPVTDTEIARAGVCNALRAGNNIFMGSDINLLEGSEYVEDYNIEKRRVEFMQNVANKLGLNLSIYCLSEALKGGACLSCNVADLRGWQFLREYDSYFKY